MNYVTVIEILTMKYIKQTEIEKELGCVFIRINPDEKNFYHIWSCKWNTQTFKNQPKIFDRQDFKKTIRTIIKVKSFNNNKDILSSL